MTGCRPLGAPVAGAGTIDSGSGGAAGGVAGGGPETEITSAEWIAVDGNGDVLGDVVVFYRFDDETGTYQQSELRNPDGTVFTLPAGATLTRAVSGAFDTEIVQLCDDVNGDGSQVVRYYAQVFTTVVSGIPQNTISGTYLDAGLQTAYVPTNPSNCDDLQGGLVPRREVLRDAGAWTSPANATSVAIETREIGDAGNPPTLTDGLGASSELLLGVTEWTSEFPSDQYSAGALLQTVTVTTQDDDLVVVTWTEVA